MKMILIVDYENVQDLVLDSVSPEAYEVWIFIGKSQNRIPFELVRAAQPFGSSLRWFKIQGEGKNNLDFHITFELGRLCTEAQKTGKIVEVFILSKDKGYDAVLKYVNESGLKTKRIVNLYQLPTSKQNAPESGLTNEVLANLTRINVSKRPRTRSTLEKHLKNNFAGRITDADIETIIEELFLKGSISESNNRLAYKL